MKRMTLPGRSGAARPLLFPRLFMLALSLLGLREPAIRRQSHTQTHTVSITRARFVPEVLTVREGDTVIWNNEDLVPHTATADGRKFDSKTIASNSSWKYVAGRPGIYPYLCALHPTMKATLVVK